MERLRERGRRSQSIGRKRSADSRRGHRLRQLDCKNRPTVLTALRNAESSACISSFLCPVAASWGSAVLQKCIYLWVHLVSRHRQQLGDQNQFTGSVGNILTAFQLLYFWFTHWPFHEQHQSKRNAEFDLCLDGMWSKFTSGRQNHPTHPDGGRRCRLIAATTKPPLLPVNNSHSPSSSSTTYIVDSSCSSESFRQYIQTSLQMWERLIELLSQIESKWMWMCMTWQLLIYTLMMGILDFS